MSDTPSSPTPKALLRFQAISAYLAEDPPRGRRRAFLEKLAGKIWTGPDGQPFQVCAETMRAWVRRYRRYGLPGLENEPHPCRGIQVLPPEIVELACQMKREVPQRSLDRIIHMMEQTERVVPNTVKRSTLHRALKQAGLSARVPVVADNQDLDRFEAVAPNDLWQSDMLAGPWLPDPLRPGKVRRAWLYAFIDDHSRLLLHGRFSFKGDNPALELVFRRAIQKYGLPRRVYYDNGATYRSHHMQQIVAELGLHRVIYTRVGRPMGHGKIEAWNRLARAAFIEEVKASSIQTLDALNEAFVAWMDLEYNRREHSETGETPLARWSKGASKVRLAEEEKLRRAFLWTERRTADKSGVFSLFGTEYQVGPTLAGRAVDVRYDPESLAEVEIWKDGRFVERVQPFTVSPHRRPRANGQVETPPPAGAPAMDWLGHLTQKRRKQLHGEDAPGPDAVARRKMADDVVYNLLLTRMDPAAVDGVSVRAFLDRYGPFDTDAFEDALDHVLQDLPRDIHVQICLDAVRAHLTRNQP